MVGEGDIKIFFHLIQQKVVNVERPLQPFGIEIIEYHARYKTVHIRAIELL